MTLTDWVLALHVISAFALIGALTVFWAVVIAVRSSMATLPGTTAGAIAKPATVLIAAGALGTVVFGVWLALDIDGYALWDGWILASLVLWAVGGWLGQRAGAAFSRARPGSPDAAGAVRQALRFHAAGSLAFLLVLVLMIWKPGA